MSIIVTQISENGVVHAADGFLTNLATGRSARSARKLFPVTKHSAGLTVAGTYAVGNERMDVWIQEFIAADLSTNLQEFANALSRAVDHEMASDAFYIFHLAGIAEAPGPARPEFYHMRNAEITSGGNYRRSSSSLIVTEDFWSQQGGRSMSEIFSSGNGYIYCNGFPNGRDIYFDLLRRMADLRSAVWNNRDWRFRPPQDAEEEAAILRKDMEQVALFFLQSNYSAPPIGGVIETLAIPFSSLP